MKITAKSRYALRILLDIAVHDKGEPRTIKEIAASQGISEKFISRIAIPLRKAGMVSTERGVNGGLRLARFPKDITLLDIVQSTDGPLALLNCLARPGTCARQGKCAAENAWSKVNKTLSESMRSIALSDVIADYRRLTPDPPKEPDYCI